ncbi:MAG: hypothetical protein E7448_00340 [Ruminococcaceae bacterium]|nr:hypothetical protein [Oscillospiraceae bacterium]
MDEMEQKLNSILANPEMMSQIMNMAQALGGKEEPEPVNEPASMPSSTPLQGMLGGIDPGTIQKMIGIAQQSGIDRNQQNLLKALRPYLSEHRIIKLEKAMRAAKIAGIATTALGGAGSIFLPGR